LVRATLEGVALNARWMQEHAEKFAGHRFDEIRLIGGGALSALWCQIFADVLDREILQIGEPRQATARGAALLGSLALGLVTTDEIPALVAPVATFSPDPANRALYDESFGNFKAHYKANRKLYRKFNAGSHRPQRRDQPET
jgi:xylulokinase